MNDKTEERRGTVENVNAEACVVLITTPVDKAEELATAIVESRLAACVNIIEQVQSVYRWEGKIQKDREALLVVKTVSSRFRDLESRVRKIHPYSCPEIIALQIGDGYADYLRWISSETNQTDSGEEKR